MNFKATPKGSGLLPVPQSVYATAKNWLNGYRLKCCGPDSYNPCNSCWNNHYYILMRLSVVRPTRIYIWCRSMWWKGTPNGSGLLPSPHLVYATAKKIKSFNILWSYLDKNTRCTTRCLDAPRLWISWKSSMWFLRFCVHKFFLKHQKKSVSNTNLNLEKKSKNILEMFFFLYIYWTY